MTYAEAFGAFSRAVMDGLHAADQADSSALLSAACYQHHVSESASFWELSADGASQSDAMVAFLARNGVGEAPAVDEEHRTEL